jgi:hypothetical protein
VHAASHLSVNVAPGIGPSQDSPGSALAMRQAARLVASGTALAEAGYDA